MDFADLDPDFFDEAIIGEAKGGRLQAVGLLIDITTVIFLELGTEATSVISMSPASANERKRYDEGL